MAPTERGSRNGSLVPPPRHPNRARRQEIGAQDRNHKAPIISCSISRHTKWALTPRAQLELTAIHKLPHNRYLAQLDPAVLRFKHQLRLLPRIEAIDAMVEPIGLASGLLALATFAFQSSITLYKTVESFQIHPKRVRDLKDELEALSGVLGSLTETVSATTDVDLSALDLPLLRCGNSCKEFEQEIMKCSSRSGGGQTSFRDWAKLRYMGDDIDGFRQLLAGYKSTIIIALTDANL
jgi:Fungal N-terminal domain of STAND proteins